MSVEFVKRWLLDFEWMHSMYRSSKNEHLNDAKTRAPPASVFLAFLFKRKDDRASRLRANVRKEFTVPVEVPYYSDVGRYMEVKYRIYAIELRMEFYFQLLQFFYRAGETIIGIHCGGKFMLVAKVCYWN